MIKEQHKQLTDAWRQAKSHLAAIGVTSINGRVVDLDRCVSRVLVDNTEAPRLCVAFEALGLTYGQTSADALRHLNRCEDLLKGKE